MSYDAFEIRILPIFFAYIALSIFGVFISSKMYFKYRERKTPPTLHLTFVFIGLTLALIVLAIGLAEAVITGFYKEIYRFSLPFAYTMIIIVDLLFVVFINEMTEKSNALLIPLAIMGSIIILLLWLPWNWWGVPQADYQGQPSIRIYSTGSLVIFSWAIFVYLAILLRRVEKKTSEKIAKLGLNLLFWAVICMILYLLMNVLDTVTIVFFGNTGYSIFIYISWIFAILVFLLSYLSLIMPEWLIKRIK